MSSRKLAALWESLGMNHGFVDENKRIAFASTIVFLEANGFMPTGTEDEWIDFIYGNLEGGTFRKQVLEDWLRSHTRPMA